VTGWRIGPLVFLPIFMWLFIPRHIIAARFSVNIFTFILRGSNALWKTLGLDTSLRAKRAFSPERSRRGSNLKRNDSFFCPPGRRLPRPYGPRNDILQRFSTKQGSNKMKISRQLSFPRRRESSYLWFLWTPACAGVTKSKPYYSFCYILLIWYHLW